jgi:hypothetical protein
MATSPSGVPFLSDASVRIVAHTALVFGTTHASTFSEQYVKLPTGANDGPVKCVTLLNFFEPPIVYANYATGDDPTTVNGVAWAGAYAGEGVGKPILGAVTGDVALCIAAGTFAAGVVVLIADAYGRVDSLANLAASIPLNPGDVIYPVGIAQTPGVANGFTEVLLDFAPSHY